MKAAAKKAAAEAAAAEVAAAVVMVKVVVVKAVVVTEVATRRWGRLSRCRIGTNFFAPLNRRLGHSLFCNSFLQTKRQN